MRNRLIEYGYLFYIFIDKIRNKIEKLKNSSINSKDKKNNKKK